MHIQLQTQIFSRYLWNVGRGRVVIPEFKTYLRFLRTVEMSDVSPPVKISTTIKVKCNNFHR